MKKAVYFIVLATLVFQTGFLSVHAQEVGTETPTLEPTNTPSPTEPPMPTVTETTSPTPSPTDTPLPTETPMETATASATPSATDTPIPTVTASATATVPPVVEDVTLSISASPNVLRRNAVLNVDWRIKGLRKIEKGMILRFYLPLDVTVVDPKIGTWNERENTFEIESPELKGSIDFNVREKVESPLVITAELLRDGTGLAKAEISLFEADETLVESKGGSADGLRGRVRVTFPAGALNDNVTVTIGKPSKESLPEESWSGTAFEITAVSNTSKMEVSEFSQPVEIQVAYSEAGLADESDLMLVWYDPTDGYWKLPLGQRVDKENNLLIAYTNHFTVFDTYNSNWQTAVTPTLAGFQHSGFTGAASYSMPIKVPAGPGGFQPNLTLSYSSSVADNAGSFSQASWVGMGWSLTDSYIERNGHGTNAIVDDSFQLNLNGMSMELFSGADGNYHTADESFYKVAFANPTNEYASAWTIWDKDGNKYYFEYRTHFYVTEGCANGYDLIPYVWRWSLTRVENVHGEIMNYSYAQNAKDIIHGDCPSGMATTAVATWVYPSEIKYSNNRYRIRFVRNNNRSDFRSIWVSPYTTYTSYQQSLLSAIIIEEDADALDGGFENIVRKYTFSYAAEDEEHIFPNLIWQEGGKTPTLKSVREFGAGATSGLPMVTFTYDDMHLDVATNGYGGTVNYDYDTQGWHETIPSSTWTPTLDESLIPEVGNPVKFKFTSNAEGWTNANANSTLSYGGFGIFVDGAAKFPNEVSSNAFSHQPGRWYMVVANVRATSGTGQIQFGFRVGSTYKWGSNVALTSAYQIVSSGPVFIPATASLLEPRISSTGISQIAWIYIYPLPTAYRVTSRTLSTTGGASYMYTYDHQNPATNNPTLSDAASGANPYVKPYTEFRGHEIVTETDPYGRTTITTYGQTDCLSGRVKNTLVKNGGIKVQETSISYILPNGSECTEWNSAIKFKDAVFNQFYDDMKYRWTRVISETSRVYNAAGVEAAHVTTDYSYNATYGNLTQKTVSGTDIDTLTTIINYSPNVSGGKWLVGLPSRVYVQKDGTTLASSMNLYDNANLYNTAPTTGILTGTRTLVRGSLYSQANIAYDDYGNVTSQTAYSGYWDGANPTIPPTGARTTTIVYDTPYHTYPISITTPPTDLYPSGFSTTINYSSVAVANTAFTGYTLGAPVWEYGPNGTTAKVFAEYDVFGRLISLRRNEDASPTLTISYQNNPFKVTLDQVIDATNTFTIERTYDGLGRPTRVSTNNDSYIVDYTYSYQGNPLVDRQSMPHTGTATAWTTIQRDALGRTLSVAAPDLTATSYSYDGLETTVTDANQIDTIVTTDVLGRTISVNASADPDIAYDYDALGNLIKATRGGLTVSMSYDKAGRKIAMDDPDMGIKGSVDDAQWGWMYDYDALGNLLEQTDARGCVLTMTYDNLNRPLTKDSSGNCGTQVSVDYGYDSTAGGNKGIGLRTSMSDGSGSTAWKYDIRGRLIKETKTITRQTPLITEWTSYNSADLPVTMKYPDGESVTTYYDGRALVYSLFSDNKTPTDLSDDIDYVLSTSYDTAGRMTSRAFGSGITQKYLFNAWTVDGGRLDMIVAGSGTWNNTTKLFTSTIQKMSYEYDEVGNITGIDQINFGPNSQTTESQTFGYDSLNRLTSWQLNNDPVKNYNYNDGTGNLIEKGDLDLEYNDTAHPHAVTDAGSNSYDYDANGNQTRRLVHTIVNGQPVTQEFEMDYDAENRLVSVTGINGTNLTAMFVYNGDGQRVKSVINGSTTLFAGGYYEVLNPGSGELVTKYYYAGASRIAMNKYSVPATMEVEYFLGDHLGSTSITTDNTGAKVSEMRYEPWGEVRYSWTSGQSTTPAYTLPKYTFTGQYSYIDDPSTQSAVEGFGLMFYNARWYDPQVGRFAQADSIVPGGMQGLDRYAYVENNPTLNVDPSGNCAQAADTQGSGCNGSGYSGGGTGGSGQPQGCDVDADHYCKLPNGIVVDISHFRTGLSQAQAFWAKLLNCFDKGLATCTFTFTQSAGIPGLASYEFQATYTLYMGGITTYEELAQAGAEVWMDFQTRFEKWEGTICGPCDFHSSFRNEDIPSTYLAYMAVVNAWLTGTSEDAVIDNMFKDATKTNSGVESAWNPLYNAADKLCWEDGVCTSRTARNSSIFFKVDLGNDIWGYVSYSGSFPFLSPSTGGQYSYKGCWTNSYSMPQCTREYEEH